MPRAPAQIPAGGITPPGSYFEFWLQRSVLQASDAGSGAVAAIRGLFDTIDHGWMQQFVRLRIGDQRLLRLIGKWLQPGVLEANQWQPCQEGAPQGAVISPLLANMYLHYVLDLWATQGRQRHAQGEVIILRYADDFILGFQHRKAVNFAFLSCCALFRTRSSSVGTL